MVYSKQYLLASINHTQFIKNLITQGEQNVSHRKNYEHGLLSIERIVIEGGFRPKIAKVVFAKMKRSGRPMSHYSKITGKLKKTAR